MLVHNVQNNASKPCSNYFTSSINDYVRLRDSDFNQHMTLTVHELIRQTVVQFPDTQALAYKKRNDGKYQNGFEFITYREYYKLICNMSKALIKLGFERGHAVCIMAFNSPSWVIMELAAIFAGGIATGSYLTNTPEALHHVASHSQAQFILVDTDEQFQKVLKIRSNLPHLKGIIISDPSIVNTHVNGVYTFDELIQMGDKEKDSNLIDRLKSQCPNQCCVLIYTSGTTGNPKGAMISQDNVTWTATWMLNIYNVEAGRNSIVSYLPLSHIAAQMIDIFGSIKVAATVYFAQPDALKGSLKYTMVEVRPTLFMGVPRIYEKMQEGIMAIGQSFGPVKKAISSWAKQASLEGSIAEIKGEEMPFKGKMAQKLFLNKIKVALGLDRCLHCLTAAAPISKSTLEYFLSLGITLHEVFGMSETTGPHTFNFKGKHNVGSVGICPRGAKLRLDNIDEEGNGEICMNGRNIFMGYLNELDKTKDTFTQDCWLKSGDLGKIDNNSFVFITGRIKELVITAGGENVAPVPIEDKIRELLPCISTAVVIGDHKKFLSVLLTFKTEIDPATSEPLDVLTLSAKNWLKSHHHPIQTVSEYFEKPRPEVDAAIMNGLNEANKFAISNAAYVQKFAILPKDFSVMTGELGPSLKLRRPIIHKKYKEYIEKIYEKQ